MRTRLLFVGDGGGLGARVEDAQSHQLHALNGRARQRVAPHHPENLFRV